MVNLPGTKPGAGSSSSGATTSQPGSSGGGVGSITQQLAGRILGGPSKPQAAHAAFTKCIVGKNTYSLKKDTKGYFVDLANKKSARVIQNSKTKKWVMDTGPNPTLVDKMI